MGQRTRQARLLVDYYFGIVRKRGVIAEVGYDLQNAIATTDGRELFLGQIRSTLLGTGHQSRRSTNND